jgi:hypothetical protein
MADIILYSITFSLYLVMKNDYIQIFNKMKKNSFMLNKNFFKLRNRIFKAYVDLDI